MSELVTRPASSLLDRGRTHTCGELRAEHVDRTVVLMGWVDNRRDHGGAIFVDLRDRFGVTQVVFRADADGTAHGLAEELRSEYCIAVAGRVAHRGDQANPRLETGEVEVMATELEVFTRAETPPFLIESASETRESLRLRYRYLDLRRPDLQRNFVLRSKATGTARRLLSEAGFIEVETPALVKNTPGGARNFLVPSRLNPHMFYALAESPQLFKQLLMVAGFDRYYQIVRCYRDEDLRGDRQPEFTQIDVEMSFATEARMFEVCETLLCGLFGEVLGVTLERPFPRLTYAEAVGRYGSDKPDLRYDLPLTDLSDLAGQTGFRVFDEAVKNGGIVKGLRLPAAAARLSRKGLDALPELVKPVGGKGVAYARVTDSAGSAQGGPLDWQAPFAKLLSTETRDQISRRMGAESGDVLLFLADSENITNNALSLLRSHMAERFGLIDASRWYPLWVTDFPLLEQSAETGDWVACHHPFTSPVLDDVAKLNTAEQGQIRARAYDLVLNGVEVAGGSIRIHQPEIQAQVFKAIGLTQEQAQEKFSFLLEAFRYGPPPHGGIAFGLDRLVMLMCGASSLRDVIAFPKTQKGTCLLTDAPGSVDPKQLKELHVRLA